MLTKKKHGAKKRVFLHHYLLGAPGVVAKQLGYFLGTLGVVSKQLGLLIWYTWCGFEVVNLVYLLGTIGVFSKQSGLLTCTLCVVSKQLATYLVHLVWFRSS